MQMMLNNAERITVSIICGLRIRLFCHTDFAKPTVFKFNNKTFLNNDLRFMNYFVTLQTDNL